MAKVVKVIELLSESSKSLEDATQGAVNEATKTWEYSLDLHQRIHRRGEKRQISNYRINAKVTFDLQRA